MVVESIDLLKAAVIFWLIGTVVAVFAGFVELTVGDVVSGVVPVVKVHGFGAKPPFAPALPPGSLAPAVMEAAKNRGSAPNPSTFTTGTTPDRSEDHTSEPHSRPPLVCR